MTIIVYGDVRNNDIIAGDIVYRNCYDPNGFLKKYGNQNDLIITIRIFVSKGGQIIALVDKITTA